MVMNVQSDVRPRRLRQRPEFSGEYSISKEMEQRPISFDIVHHLILDAK